jgi:hypothetical protein
MPRLKRRTHVNQNHALRDKAKVTVTVSLVLEAQALEAQIEAAKVVRAIREAMANPLQVAEVSQLTVAARRLKASQTVKAENHKATGVNTLLQEKAAQVAVSRCQTAKLAQVLVVVNRLNQQAKVDVAAKR